MFCFALALVLSVLSCFRVHAARISGCSVCGFSWLGFEGVFYALSVVVACVCLQSAAMATNYKVKLYSVADESAMPKLLSPFVCQSTDTYHDLRVRLEKGSYFDWPFEFWDFDDQCRIRKKFEAMNPVIERMYVIPEEEQQEGGAGKRRRCDEVGGSGSNNLTASLQVEPPEFPNQEFNDEDPIPEAASQEGSDFEIGSEIYLLSTLISIDVMEKYNAAVVKLRKELESMDFADHLWNLKSYDLIGVPIVKILCGECQKEFGGTVGDHSKTAIHNLFANFKKSHLHSTLHIKQWCKRNNVVYNDHPKKGGNKGKPLMYTTADHKRLVEEGLSILKSVNDEISEVIPPFVIVGDVEHTQLKSFWYKVRCKINGQLLLLCPPKNNLRANLENHLQGFTHTRCVEGFGSGGMSTTSSAISTARRGRPSARSKQIVGNQPDLHGWFGQHAAVRSKSSDGSHLGKPDSILALLCWRLRRETTEYGGKCYRVNALLDDPKPGALWAAEPTTSATFSCADEEVVVAGCFRHSACKWVSGCGEPFANFTYAACSKIVQENDFRLRVMKEGRALVKRGSRDIGSGRRIDYLSIRELAGNSRRLATKYREERALHW